MNRWLVLLAVASMAASITAAATKQLVPVMPQPIFGTVLSPQETEKYLNAAVKYSPYSKPWIKRLKIDIVPVAKWREQVCGAEDYNCGILGYTSDHERDVVHIVEVIPQGAVDKLGWTRDEIIVHEVVHWLQHENGRMYPDQCAQLDADETEAYNAQFQYAVQVLGADHGFWKPDVYGSCTLTKMMRQRGHH